MLGSLSRALARLEFPGTAHFLDTCVGAKSGIHVVCIVSTAAGSLACFMYGVQVLHCCMCMYV